MNQSTIRRLVVVVFALLVATAAVATTGTASYTVVIEDAQTGEPLLEQPVDDGTEITLAYTHSVEKTPVRDVYVVDGTELRMVRTEFHSHGAGLPTSSDIERTDDGFVLELDDSYEEIVVAPGSIAGHELFIGDERYDLVALADGSVVISLTDRTLLDTIGGQHIEVQAERHTN